MEIKDELLDIEGIQNSKKPLLDLFIRRTAVLTQTDESMTDKIIRDQWRNANKVSQRDSQVAEIDFPNLGVLYMSKNKGNKRIKKMENHIKYVERLPHIDDERELKTRVNSINRYQDIINQIKYKTKQS